VLIVLAFVLVGMFGFGFALIPMYRAICRITGINVATPLDESAAAFAKSTQVDASRFITVQFDANARGPWQFKPLSGELRVHPGQLTTVQYEVTNGQSRDMQAQAIPSFAPGQAMPFFRKVECFCFQQQTLKAHETREFPVVFVIDPKIPKDVSTITLSYTFFEVPGAAAATAKPAIVVAGHG
jgi:cytochrome c oxidase assembly protein subunit 11